MKARTRRMMRQKTVYDLLFHRIISSMIHLPTSLAWIRISSDCLVSYISLNAVQSPLSQVTLLLSLISPWCSLSTQPRKWTPRQKRKLKEVRYRRLSYVLLRRREEDWTPSANPANYCCLNQTSGSKTSRRLSLERTPKADTANSLEAISSVTRLVAPSFWINEKSMIERTSQPV